MNEGVGTVLTIAALSSMLCASAVASAGKFEKEAKAVAAEKGKPATGKDLTKLMDQAATIKKSFGGYSAMQATNILARTLKAEAGADKERKAGGHKLVADVILNRCDGNLDEIVQVCLEKSQFSCWNKADHKTLTPENYVPQIPGECKDNVLEQKAWKECLELAGDIISGKYKARNKKVNSYYVYTGKNAVNPSWGSKMTNTVTAGSQKFGYLKDNNK